jgi:hypothetical protein
VHFLVAQAVVEANIPAPLLAILMPHIHLVGLSLALRAKGSSCDFFVASTDVDSNGWVLMSMPLEAFIRAYFSQDHKALIDQESSPEA